MTRPASHHEIEIPRRCGNCKFAEWPTYKDHLLCFHGDSIKVSYSHRDRFQANVDLDGESVCFMEGDEYDRVWAGRVVDPNLEVCDEWEPRKEAS